ncbi:jg12211 [Pararge aegeria aegeria]|uniref:Jg12211 protein n=1 Tax=Pararge aegeria aegeria TaxID=348720 RepID=A0A8S4QZV7_9NEOP|nr:jg12211 [Pararge aegeria aegeria]
MACHNLHKPEGECTILPLNPLTEDQADGLYGAFACGGARNASNKIGPPNVTMFLTSPANRRRHGAPGPLTFGSSRPSAAAAPTTRG